MEYAVPPIAFNGENVEDNDCDSVKLRSYKQESNIVHLKSRLSIIAVPVADESYFGILIAFMKAEVNEVQTNI